MNPEDSPLGGVESRDFPGGATPAQHAPADSDLAALVAAWSSLPPAVRDCIKTLVKTAAVDKERP